MSDIFYIILPKNKMCCLFNFRNFRILRFKFDKHFQYYNNKKLFQCNFKKSSETKIFMVSIF